MKRSGPPARRTPLRAKGPMRRSPSNGKPKSNRTKVPKSSIDAVVRRSGGRCEVGVHVKCTGRGEHKHHRRMRSQRGSHHPDNLLDVCHLCHRWIHDHTGISYEKGWLIRSGV